MDWRCLSIYSFLPLLVLIFLRDSVGHMHTLVAGTPNPSLQRTPLNSYLVRRLSERQ